LICTSVAPIKSVVNQSEIRAPLFHTHDAQWLAAVPIPEGLIVWALACF
jgi:hypothetical protein